MITVRPGDTLFEIAQRSRVSLRSLIDANPQLRNPNMIRAGQQLQVPGDTFQSSTPAPTPTGNRRATLMRGMTGGLVRELQRHLVAEGHLRPADAATGPGVFGPRTEAAVRAFQGREGLPVDGVVGPRTWAALLGDGFAPAHSETTVSDVPRTLGTNATVATVPLAVADNTRVAPRATGVLRNTRAWEPVNAPLTSRAGSRSRALYDAVLDQFDVGRNPRYARRDGNTYCNIFAWDATRAMGAEVPHWVSGHELDANSLHRWLGNEGGRTGWRRVNAQEAQAQANLGRPTLATWYNPGGIGHVAMVRPGAVTPEGPTIAQAGRRNFNHGQLQQGFGHRPAVFWAHV